MNKSLIHCLSAICLISCVAEPAFAQRSRFRRSLRNNSAVKAGFKDAIAEPAKSTVRILIDDEPVALGCVVSAEGEILTKASLVEEEGTLTVLLPDGSKVAAKRQSADEPFDVMLIKAASGKFVPVKFSDTSLTAGRFVALPAEDGKIIGVGLVTVDTKRAGLRSRSNAPPQRTAYLGVSLAAASGGGMIVNRDVERDAPVYRYGIRKDDKITSLDGFKINSIDDVRRILLKHDAGDRIAIKLERDGDEKTARIRLGSPPGIDQWGGGPFSKRRYNFPIVVTHDIRIRPEECGGPLVSSSGEVVGLNIARALRVATYAVPSDAIPGLLTKLRERVAETTTTATDVSLPSTSLRVPKPN